MSFVIESLRPSETVLFNGVISFWDLVPELILGTIIMLFALGFAFLMPVTLLGASVITVIAIVIGIIGMFTICTGMVRYYTTELALTDQRVIYKVGFLRRRTMVINIEMAESQQVNQSWIGKKLGFGDLTVSAAGEVNGEFRNIVKPVVFGNQVEDARAEAKLRDATRSL